MASQSPRRVPVSRQRWLALLALLALFTPLLLLSSTAHAQSGCSFSLGFKVLRDQLPQVVGECLENEHPNPASGNVEQRTTGGLLVYRPADNWTAFTNGATTWINGPFGVESRPNSATLPWEARAPLTVPAPTTVGTAQADLQRSGWAKVVQVVSPEALIVSNDSGQEFGVWHIGIVGPAQNQGDWRPQATAEHARRLPAGTRVWLEAEDGISNPKDGVVLRHVFRDGDTSKPLAADLLRAGSVWVFPDGRHRFLDLYGDRQAESVLGRTGGWGQSGSTAIFRPRGVTHGGFPINTAVLPALNALDANEMGHNLLVSVNAFPVEIGVSPATNGSVGYFAPRYYTIQLGSDVISASPEAIAAVLIHELTHTQQMINKFVDGNDISCVDGEIEAFNAAAQFWSSVYGRSGKPRPSHWLDRELNTTLRQYAANQIEARVLQTYTHQCATAGSTPGSDP